MATIRELYRGRGIATIEGLGMPYYRSDDPGTEYRIDEKQVERVLPGAFDPIFAHNEEVRALYAHNSDNIIARRSAKTLRFSLSKRGLRYEMDLPDSQLGRDMLANVRHGNLDGASVGMMVLDFRWQKERDGLRVFNVRAIDLREISLTSIPAYRSTSSRVASADREALEAEFEEELYHLKLRQLQQEGRVMRVASKTVTNQPELRSSAAARYQASIGAIDRKIEDLIVREAAEPDKLKRVHLAVELDDLRQQREIAVEAVREVRE